MSNITNRMESNLAVQRDYIKMCSLVTVPQNYFMKIVPEYSHPSDTAIFWEHYYIPCTLVTLLEVSLFCTWLRIPYVGSWHKTFWLHTHMYTHVHTTNTSCFLESTRLNILNSEVWIGERERCTYWVHKIISFRFKN